MHNTYRGWEEMKIYLKLHENLILFHFIYLALPQAWGHQNNTCQLLWVRIT